MDFCASVRVGIIPVGQQSKCPRPNQHTADRPSFPPQEQSLKHSCTHQDGSIGRQHSMFAGRTHPIKSALTCRARNKLWYSFSWFLFSKIGARWPHVGSNMRPM